jgi:hypothetical protein
VEGGGVSYIEKKMLLELERLLRAFGGDFEGSDEAKAINQVLRDLTALREICTKWADHDEINDVAF